MLNAFMQQAEAANKTDSLMGKPEVEQKIRRYQDWAEKKLKPDLEKTDKRRDNFYKQLGEYMQLKNTL